MSDTNEGQVPGPESQPGQDDNLKNIKSEMGRKFSNVDATLQQMTSQLQAISERFNSIPQSKAEPEDDVDYYSDPDAYIEKKVEERIKGFTSDFEKKQSIQARQTQIVNEISAEFPEIHQQGSELQTKAQEIYSSLTPEEQQDPLAWKAVVYQAATSVGARPRSQRSGDGEDFVLGAARGSSSSLNRSSKKKSDELAPELLAFAEALKMDISDPETIKKLKYRAQRKDWKYSGSQVKEKK